MAIWILTVYKCHSWSGLIRSFVHVAFRTRVPRIRHEKNDVHRMRVKVFIEQGKLKAMLVKKNSQDFFLFGESEGKDFTSCVVAEKFAHFDEYRLLELKDSLTFLHFLPCGPEIIEKCVTVESLHDQYAAVENLRLGLIQWTKLIVERQVKAKTIFVLVNSRWAFILWTFALVGGAEKTKQAHLRKKHLHVESSHVIHFR